MTDTSEVAPVQAEDIELDDDALASSSAGLAERLANQPPVRRGRGRPPGSRNKTTIAREEAVARGEYIPPSTRGSVVRPGRQAPPPRAGKEPKPQIVRDVEKVKKAAVDYQNLIVEELNENILSVFMGLGIPSNMLYKPGHEPSAQVSSNKYTELGAKLVLNPSQAKVLGRFAAELAATKSGETAAAMVQNNTAMLVVYGLLSVGAGFQYLSGVKQVIDNVRLLQGVAAQAQQQQEQQPQEPGYGTTEPIPDINREGLEDNVDGRVVR